MDSKEINVVRVSHPANQEVFRMLATPPEVIKAGRSTAQTQCTTCFQPHPKLQTCERCKSTFYCSKACQKKDWPRHKTWCTPADRPKGVKKLIETIVCNITLFTTLETCAALQLELVNDKKKEIGFKVPFMIRVDIAVEPSDVMSLVKLLTDNSVPEKMEGMVQINYFHSHIPGRSGYVPLMQSRDTMWRRERERANGVPTDRNDPVGLVEFVNDSDFSITIPLRVRPPSMNMARKKEPFIMFSGVTGTSSRPMTVDTCMEFMNTHIRLDKKNELKLRTLMTDADKATVRGIRDQSNTKDAVVLLRQKMARERIYASLRTFMGIPAS